MKRRWWNDSMTLLVIRDAEKAVRQVSVPKMLIVSVPIVALMSLSGVILSMQLKSTQQIHDLEGKLSNKSWTLDVTVKDKDEAIRLLQNEIVRLSAEAEAVKDKVQQIGELEDELKDFLHTYLGTDAVEADRSTVMTDWDATEQLGGIEHRVSNEDLIRLAQQSSFQLSTVSNMIQSLESTIPANLQHARDKLELIAGTPSIWPTNSRRLSSSFGYRKDPLTGRAAFHAGLDIKGEVGDPVFAAADGRVITAEFSNSRGNYVVVRHLNGLDSWYMHMSKIIVEVNQEVKKGDRIGKVGNSGRSTGPHLHFEIIQNNKAINPLPYLKNS